MWSLGTLRAVNDAAHTKAEEAKKKPKMLTPNAIEQMPPFTIPNLDGYCPRDWYEIERWRCNKNGGEDRYSLSADGLKTVMEEQCAKHGHCKLGWAICEEGQFQIYIAAYLKLQYAVEGISWGYTDDELVIQVSEDLQKELAERAEDECDWESDETMRGILLPLVCNSELHWVEPEETGDLTSAPILGILGEVQTEKSGPFGCKHAGCWCDEGDLGPPKQRYHPIIKRWGWMEYQVSALQTDLASDGEVVLVSGISNV